MVIGEESHKTFAYAWITLLLKVKRLLLYLSCKVKKRIFEGFFSTFVATELTSQRYNASQYIHWRCVQEQCSFFYFTTFTHIMPDLVQTILYLGSSYVQFASCAFGFTLYWTANCLSAEPWIDFSDKPFMNGRKVYFIWHDLPFWLNFDIYFFQ